MLIKTYKLDIKRLNPSYPLSSLYRLSKKVENFRNKDYYSSKNNIVTVEQYRMYYQRKFINLLFFNFLKFGYKNVSKYSIFKFKLFEKKELSDVYIADSFLIKNLEFKKYFLFCKKIKNISLKKYLRAFFLNTSFRLRTKLLVKLVWSDYNKKKVQRKRRQHYRKKFSFRTFKKIKISRLKRCLCSFKIKKKITYSSAKNLNLSYLKLIKLQKKLKQTRKKLFKINKTTKKIKTIRKAFNRQLKKKRFFSLIFTKTRLNNLLNFKGSRLGKFVSAFFFSNRKNKVYFKVKLKNMIYKKKWYSKLEKLGKVDFLTSSCFKRYFMDLDWPLTHLDVTHPVRGSLAKLSKNQADEYRVNKKFNKIKGKKGRSKVRFSLLPYSDPVKSKTSWFSNKPFNTGMYNNVQYHSKLLKKIQNEKKKFYKNIKLHNIKPFKRRYSMRSKPYECFIKPYISVDNKVNNNKVNNNKVNNNKVNNNKVNNNKVNNNKVNNNKVNNNKVNNKINKSNKKNKKWYRF